MLPLILPGFRRDYPEVELVVVTSSAESLFERLQTGHVDLAILPRAYSLLAQGFHAREIYRERLVLVTASGTLPSGITLSSGAAVFPRNLDGLPFIMSRKGHSLFAHVEMFMLKNGISPKVVFETNSNITAMRLAATGLGVCIVPEMTTRLAQCPDAPDFYSIGEPPLRWDVLLYSRRDTHFGKIENAFLLAAQEAFRDFRCLS